LLIDIRRVPRTNIRVFNVSHMQRYKLQATRPFGAKIPAFPSIVTNDVQGVFCVLFDARRVSRTHLYLCNISEVQPPLAH
jgi:hypothetical protein